MTITQLYYTIKHWISMYTFSKYGRTYYDYDTRQWVSYKPKKFFVGYDKFCNRVYVGDTVRYYDRWSKDYKKFTIEDQPTHSGRISNGWISLASKEITLIKH